MLKAEGPVYSLDRPLYEVGCEESEGSVHVGSRDIAENDMREIQSKRTKNIRRMVIIFLVVVTPIAGLTFEKRKKEKKTQTHEDD